MIWIANAGGRNENPPPVASHILGVISENCGSFLNLDETQVRELALAVDSYLKDSKTSGMYGDSGYLVLLASKALISLGERKAAHRLVVFGTGLVHPSEWIFCGGGSIWTLDLGRMAVRSDASLELVFFNSLNVVIESIAEVWDATEGRGTLGLRNAVSAASEILRNARKQAISAFANEIRHTCEAKLKQLCAKRGWIFVPDLMNVDLQPESV